jgi:hypothetical protein
MVESGEREEEYFSGPGPGFAHRGFESVDQEVEGELKLVLVVTPAPTIPSLVWLTGV